MLSDENRRFAKLLITLSLPIILQQLVNSSLNMLDVFMIGQLGETPIAAAGLGNQVFFLFTILTFGINSGAAIFMAQYWGRGDVENIHRTMGICFTFNMIAAIIFCCGAVFIPEKILYIYSKDAAVIELGAKYLRIVGPSYLFGAITNTYAFSCRSVGRTVLPMLVAFFSLCCNGVLNAIFIFGLLGFPALGVEGAALGTLISRFFEVIVAVFLVYKMKLPIAARPRQYFSFDKAYVRAFLATAGFVILNELFWSLGVSLYNSGYRFAGTDAQAAVQIANNVKDLFMVVSYGIGSSAAVTIGNRLGAGMTEEAVLYSKKYTKVVIAFGVLLAVLLVLTIPFIVKLFNVTEVVRSYARYIVYGMAICFPFKCLNHLNIVGILRSGGDTRTCLLIDLGGVWAIGVPMAFLGTLVFHLPIYLVTFLVFMEDPIKSVFSQWRVNQKKWLRDIRL